VAIAATIALFPAALAVFDNTQATPRGTWVLFAVAAVLLATSLSTGPVWVVVVLGAAALLQRPTALAPRLRALAPVGALVAVAAASTVVWEASVPPGRRVDWGLALDQLGPAASDIGRTVRESVAVFGVTNNVHLPDAVVYGWLVGVAAFVAAAFAVAGRRERTALALVVAAAAASVVALSALVFRQSAFGIQGRHVLPVLALVPLCAAHVLCRRGRVRGLVVTAAVVAVGVHALALWVNDGAYAGGVATGAGPMHVSFDVSSLAWPVLIGLVGCWLVVTVLRSNEAGRGPGGTLVPVPAGHDRNVR
jgi:hypothetical protein